MPITANGASRKTYAFEKHSIGVAFEDINAVYMYAREESKGGSSVYAPIYIGKSTELGKRVANHAHDGVLNCAKQNGANCFLVHHLKLAGIMTAELQLEAIEKDLLAEHKTPCNTQHN